MKETGEWNPYYMNSPYGFCQEQRIFPWLYPYGNQLNYWRLWNIPEKMEEEADADYVVILNHGQIAAEGTPLSLKNTYTGDFITLYGVDEAEVRQLGAPYVPLRAAFRVSVPDTAAATALIQAHPAVFRDYEIIKGRMDDVFLAVTGEQLNGGAAK